MIPKKDRVPRNRPLNYGHAKKEPAFDADSYLSSFDNIEHARQALDVREQMVLDEALRSDDPNQIVKAMNKLSLGQKDFGGGMFGSEKYGGKSMLIDPYSMPSQGQYLLKQNFVDPRTLRNMAKTPFIKAIIETRVEQVASFAKYSEHMSEVGWMIKRRDKDVVVQDQDLGEIKRIRDFILNTGIDTKLWIKDDFDKFLRKITKDTLELDAMTFEIVRQRNEDLYDFFATDAGTFYYADPREMESQGEEVHGYFPVYVQVHQGSVINDYYPWELCYGVRNASSDIWRNGYGRSELEDLINVVTWQLYGMQYTGAFFSRGSAPKGILKINGNVNERRLQEFKQQWQAQVQGVRNAWKTPIMEADKMEWVDLQKTNRDMEFANWISFLTKMACAIYKIDPSEIGMPQGQGTGEGSSSIFGSDNQKERVLFSKEKGLKPLLKFIESKIDKYVVQQLNPDYEFVFTGTNFTNPQTELEEDVKKLGNFMKVDEIREKYNLDPLGESDGGDLVLNPVWWQAKSQANMAEQQQMGGEESNEFMQDEYDGYEENPYGKDQESEQAGGEYDYSNEKNPFLKSMNQATSEFLNTLK
jgi:hypothetical protein